MNTMLRILCAVNVVMNLVLLLVELKTDGTFNGGRLSAVLGWSVGWINVGNHYDEN